MSQIDIASEVLNQGGIIIYPTDTAFGIGCRLDYEKAIKKLFDIRKRPINQAVPVLFDSKSRIQDYIQEIDDKVDDLMDEYFPGALTIVLPSIQKSTNFKRSLSRSLNAKGVLSPGKFAEGPRIGASTFFIKPIGAE